MKKELMEEKLSEPIQILAEAKPGIDPTTTALITDPNEYWLKDETETPSMTLFDGIIPNNHWEIDGDTLQINLTGTVSECWELDGTTLQIKI